MSDRPLAFLESLHELQCCLSLTRAQLRQMLDDRGAFYRVESVIDSRGKARQLHKPRYALKQVQKRLAGWLSGIPLHNAAHGWRIGRSCVTNARPHLGKDVLLKADLENFFPSVRPWQVRHLFQELGCNEEVAGALTRLTTADNRLPMGFPSSPAIANLLLRSLDHRLALLAVKAGASYTRQGDDLTFSGSDCVRSLEGSIRRIISAEKFSMNEEKFLEGGLLDRNGPQVICGISVHGKLNLPAPIRRIYRAIVHNCLQYGAQSQLRDGETIDHLRRRIYGYICYFHSVNPGGARKLKAKYARIIWA